MAYSTARRTRGAAVTIAGLVMVDAVIRQPRWLTALARWLVRDVLFDVRTPRRVVALTFDDGPHDVVTPAVLDVLARHDATATFFLIGGRVAGNEDIVSRIVREGHELGNHLMDATPTVTQSVSAFGADLVACDEVLAEWGPARFFRPASGLVRTAMVALGAAQGYRCALGSAVLLRDPITRVAPAVRLLLTRVRPGSVVVLHEGSAERASVVECVDLLLTELSARGYTAVSLSELVDSEAGRDVCRSTRAAPRPR